MFAFSSTPAFGSTSSPFGAQSSVIGAQSTAPTFGSTGFGQIPSGGKRTGSRAVPYTSTNENSGVCGWPSGKLVSISAMPQYEEKSHEELRWEDYQLGDNAMYTAASLFSSPFEQKTSTFAQTTFTFGQESATNPFSSSLSSILTKSKPIQPPKRSPKPSRFGAAAIDTSSPSAFSTHFGASSSTSPFGTPSSSSSLTKFASLSPFGVSNTTAFSSTPFGQASQPASLFSSTPLLGSSAFGTTTPFGNTQSSGLFQSSTSTFGQSTPIFVHKPAFSASSTPAFGASSATPSFGSGTISEDPDSGNVDTVWAARLDKVMLERDRLRFEVEATRVERDMAIVERDKLRKELEERGGGNGSFGNGVVVTVLERQLRQAQQDAQYYAGEASYYHGMLVTHAPDAPVPPFSRLASDQSHSRSPMDPPHGGKEDSGGHEE